MKKDDVNLLLYEHIYDKLYDIRDRNNEVEIWKSKTVVAHSLNIPYILWHPILKIMEDMDWLEKVNHKLIRLKKKPVKILDNCSKVYDELGMWDN